VTEHRKRASELIEKISKSLTEIGLRIGNAAARSGRSADDVWLVGISKRFGQEYIEAACAAGIEHIGESRVQEAAVKLPALVEKPVLHMVGHLQSNKAKQALGLFDWIHSIDSSDLVNRIGRISGEMGKKIRTLVQVDLADEPSKFGAGVDEIGDILEAARAWPDVSVEGLMCVPPYFDDPEDVRPYFTRLRHLSEEFHAKGLFSGSFAHLSMGMSHDYEIAIEEGATMVRIGTAIFGTRS